MSAHGAAAVLLLFATAAAAEREAAAQEDAPTPGGDAQELAGAASPAPGTGPPADALVLRARELLDRGEWSAALALLRPAIEERRDDPAFQSALARTYAELADEVPPGSDAPDANLERAMAAARRAVRLAPDWGWAHLDLAAALGKLANASGPRTRVRLAPEVASEARRALELDPTLWQAHHVLGIWHREIATLGLFQQLGAALLGGVPDASLEESIAHLETATRLAPRIVRNRLQLGITYEEAGREAAARAELRRALELPPSEPRDRELQREARRRLEELEA